MNPRTNSHKSAALALAVLLTPAMSCIAFADSSYQSTTQITGGQMVEAVKRMSFLSKSLRNMFEPTTMQMMVSGNRKVMVGKDATDIVDLDKKEMIHIDTVHRTYSVVTFAQMRQALEAAAEKAKEAPQQESNKAQPQEQQKPNVKVTFNASVNNTGQSKLVEGMTAQEQIVTVTMTATDETNPANNGTFTVTTDAWIVPDPPEMKEVADFDRRMAKEMMEDVYGPAMAGAMGASGGSGGAGMAQLLSSRPGASDAMSQMAKELAKIKGTRVQEDMSMSATAPQKASDQQQQANSESNSETPTSRGGLENAAAGKLVGGMLGGWHHKKAKQAEQQQSDTSTTTTANGQVMQTVTLLSMRDQKSNFSQQPVPAAAFEIPAGFTQVPSAYERMK